MSDAEHNDSGSMSPGSAPRMNDTGDAAAASPQRMGPERWVIAGGTVVALVAGFIAVTSGGTPSHAMPSPFTAPPSQSAPAQGGPGHGISPPATTPATCISVTPVP